MDDHRSVPYERWQTVAVFAGLAVLLALSGFALPIALLLVLPALGLFVVIGRLERGMEAAPPRPDWMGRSVVSGFVASAGMMLAFAGAFGIAQVLGAILPGSSTSATGVQVAAWFFNLAHNVVTDVALGSMYVSAGVHLALGTAFAMLYGRYAEQRLTGPHWARGLLYAFIPWTLSVTVFFPLAGAGLFGIALGAGPLPFLGNLLLHAVYGAALGLIYGPLGDTLPGDESAVDEEEADDMHHADAGAAKGIAAGAAMGLLAGTVVAVLLPDLNAAPWQADLVGLALLGGAVGALVGSLFGLPSGSTSHAH